MTKEQIQRIAGQLAEYHTRMAEYNKEFARVNLDIAMGFSDVYTAKFPKHPRMSPVRPVVWVNPDGTSFVNPCAEEFNGGQK